MHILSIVPLTKIPLPAPQVLDYFSSTHILTGGIAQISLNNRKLLGIVLASSPVAERKQAVKKAGFRLKAIEMVICQHEAVPKTHLKLIIWASQYYYAPLGLVAKTLLPHYFFKPTKQFLLELSSLGAQDDSAPQETRMSIVPELYKIKLLQNRNPRLQNAAILHGGILPKKEWEIWKLARKGQLKNILGTRSVLAVAPAKLASITVYDPESPYHKSFDQQPYINAKDIAAKLAGLHSVKILLRSSFNAQKLCAQAEITDMRKELKAGNYSVFSRKLQAELANILTNKRQAILFINRKGLSSGLLCRDCGHIVKCANCDAAMTYQIIGTRPQLICRHCAKMQKPASLCPVCQSYRIKFIGAGTQRVEAQLLKLFPDASFAKLDLDVAPDWERQEKVLKEFSAKKFAVLIGTQLMLKKGLLPKVDLASIITADPLLSLPDFRVGEHIARIVDMLARSSKKLVIQTYKPENEIFTCLLQAGPAKFYCAFMAQEIAARKELCYPPFSQLIKLTYAHKDPQKAEQEARILKNKLQQQLVSCQLSVVSCQILGPSPAFIPRVKNRYTWQIMIKSTIEDLRIRNKLLSVIPSDWRIDVDPVEML